MPSLTERPGWRAFRSRDFRFNFYARIASTLSGMMIDVAVGWLIYDITHSPLALGLAGLTAFVPNVLFMLIVGHVADRHDRRLVMIGSTALNALASLGLYVLALADQPHVALIYALIFIYGTARSFLQPAAQAIITSLVSEEDFPNALAWNSSAWQTASITGPALGGLFYAFGASTVFAITTALLVLSVICLTQLHPREGAVLPSKSISWAYLTAGFTSIWANPNILGAISVDLFAVLLGGSTALLPIYAHDIFFTGPWGLGILRSMPAVGALLCSLAIAHYQIKRHTGYKMFGAVAVFGLATIGFGLSTSFWMALPFLFLMGVADMISVVIRQTLVQLETPNEMRGRVSAVNSVFIGASNELGEFESGALASLIGTVPSVVIGGLGSVIIAVVWMKLFPTLRDRDELILDQK
jgi:MFS family permease